MQSCCRFGDFSRGGGAQNVSGGLTTQVRGEEEAVWRRRSQGSGGDETNSESFVFDKCGGAVVDGDHGEHRRHQRSAAEPVRRHEREPADSGGHSGQDLRRHEREFFLRAGRLLRHVLRQGREPRAGQDVHQIPGRRR